MDTLLLSRTDVSGLLEIGECMYAVEAAFRMYGEGRTLPPKVIGLHHKNGGFHIKAGILTLQKEYFVAKVNANFPGNSKQYNLPTIQGVIVMCDVVSGRVLAVMDSIEITIIRTGAATGIAAKYLAVTNATVVTICGCGNQGRISLKALMKVRSLRKLYIFDIEKKQAEKFAKEFGNNLEIIITEANDLPAALRESQIIVTCTPSKEPFIYARDIMPGCFIAAVGADSEEKQELCTDLIASNKIVVDIAQQSAGIGELHHAIREGLITVAGIHAELGCIIAGKKSGRESDNEIIIFDSTGTALQDVAAAAIVYEKALSLGVGHSINFSKQMSSKFKENNILAKRLRLWYPFR